MNQETKKMEGLSEHQVQEYKDLRKILYDTFNVPDGDCYYPDYIKEKLSSCHNRKVPDVEIDEGKIKTILSEWNKRLVERGFNEGFGIDLDGYYDLLDAIIKSNIIRG